MLLGPVSMPRHSAPSVPNELIEQKIYLIRRHKVMLDAGSRPIVRSNDRQSESCRPQKPEASGRFHVPTEPGGGAIFVIANCKSKAPGRSAYTAALCLYRPRCCVAMLSSVLNSERVIEVNIAIMRAFVRLRVMLAYPRRSRPASQRTRAKIRHA